MFVSRGTGGRATDWQYESRQKLVCCKRPQMLKAETVTRAHVTHLVGYIFSDGEGEGKGVSALLEPAVTAEVLREEHG
jgi:hypothetical protein